MDTEITKKNDSRMGEKDSKPGAEISEERVGRTRRTGRDHSKRSGGELQSMSFSEAVGGGQERDNDLEPWITFSPRLHEVKENWPPLTRLQGMQYPQGTPGFLRTIHRK